VDPVALCAGTTADWHASWLTSLGLRSERRDSVWRALDPPPFIYWTAIPLAPDASAPAVCDARGTLCDSWSSLDLTPFGFEERLREPWFLRPARAPPSGEGPSDLEVVRVSTPAQVAEFENVSARGFGGEDVEMETGAIHPATILADARMTMLTGRVGEIAVAAR
jgi:hypothetical protein